MSTVIPAQRLAELVGLCPALVTGSEEEALASLAEGGFTPTDGRDFHKSIMIAGADVRYVLFKPDVDPTEFASEHLENADRVRVLMDDEKVVYLGAKDGIHLEFRFWPPTNDIGVSVDCKYRMYGLADLDGLLSWTEAEGYSPDRRNKQNDTKNGVVKNVFFAANGPPEVIGSAATTNPDPTVTRLTGPMPPSSGLSIHVIAST